MLLSRGVAKRLADLDNQLHKAHRDALSETVDLVSIEDAGDSLLLRLANGTAFTASMNEHNRRKYDSMTSFPTLAIENYNSSHGSLEADGIVVVCHLYRE